MPYGTPPLLPGSSRGRFNRFLATLPPHDFSLLASHLRTLALERGVMLHDVGERIEHIYFPRCRSWRLCRAGQPRKPRPLGEQES